MRTLMQATLIAGLMAAATSAQSAVVTLNFEGIAPHPNDSNVRVDGYYNGGVSSIGTSGPNVGVEFTTDVLLLCLNTAGVSCSNTSKGGLGVPGSDKGAIFFLSGLPIMNVAAGFDTGFSGAYSAPFTPGTTIRIFDGLNATGTQLAMLTLGTTPTGTCNPVIAQGAQYCPFVNFSLGFAGTGRSVAFGGRLNQQVFDDLTFGSITTGGTVPEPANWAMLIAGFGITGAVMRRRRNVAITA